MDQPGLKNEFDKNCKLILALYSVCTVWQSFGNRKYIEIYFFN